MTIIEVEAAPAGAVEERRSVGSIEEVRFPERLITILAMPYNTPTPRASNKYIEEFAPGAFHGLEHRNGRIRVNREHVLTAPVGRVETWYADRDDALIGTLKVSKTQLGDETLELAADGVLDASVGFLPMPGGEQWTEHRTHRRVTKAWLHHLALTGDPAYDGAQVLDVRRATDEHVREVVDGTPVKDSVLAMLRERGQLRL